MFAQADSAKAKIRVIAVHGLVQPEVAALLDRQLKGVDNSTKLDLRLKMLPDLAAESGYPEFAIENTKWSHDTLHVWLHQGPGYFYRQIMVRELDELTYRKAGFEKLQQKNAPFSPRDFERRMRFCLNEFQNEGFPFAAFKREEISYYVKGMDSVMVDLLYEFEPGMRIVIDTVRFVGNKRGKRKLP